MQAIDSKSWILTQKQASLMDKFLTCWVPSYSFRSMRHLSKFHGLSLKTLSLSSLSSNSIRIISTPSSWNLVVFIGLHIFCIVDLNASRLKGQLVFSFASKHWLRLATNSVRELDSILISSCYSSIRLSWSQSSSTSTSIAYQAVTVLY